jgi:putative FmdB family regulatory protein
MPLYEYKCGSCGETFEVRQNFSDAPLTVHEKCGGPVERLISLSSLKFKGTGWYVTDYAKGNGANPPAKEGKKDGKKEGSSSTDSPAKTESKTSSTTPASTSDKKV